MERFVPLPNLMRGPGRFALSTASVERARTLYGGCEIAIFHTHASDPTPSEADLRALQRAKFPWLICAPERLLAVRHGRKPTIIQVREEVR